MIGSNEKLRELQENTPTIIAPNCWGGLTYHRLGLKFCSPFINMWENHDDYLKILSDLEYYLAQEPKLKEMYNGVGSAPYPIVTLGDVTIRMNHYRTFEQALECWERRKARIKWDNLIVTLWDEDINRIKRFMALNYNRKICFAPFKVGIEGVITIPYRDYDNVKGKEFWEIMNNLAQGKYIYYDALSLIYSGDFVKVGNFEYNPDYNK